MRVTGGVAAAALAGLLVLGGCSAVRFGNHLSAALDFAAGGPGEDEAPAPVVGYAGPAPEAVEDVYYGRLPAGVDPARPRACFFRVEGARHVVLAGDPLYGALMPQHPDYAEYLAIDEADLSEADRALCAAHFLTRDLADFRALSARLCARITAAASIKTILKCGGIILGKSDPGREYSRKCGVSGHSPGMEPRAPRHFATGCQLPCRGRLQSGWAGACTVMRQRPFSQLMMS